MVEVPTLPLRSFFILMFATCIAVSVNDVASFQAGFLDIDRVHPLENTGITCSCVCVWLVLRPKCLNITVPVWLTLQVYMIQELLSV